MNQMTIVTALLAACLASACQESNIIESASIAPTAVSDQQQNTSLELEAAEIERRLSNNDSLYKDSQLQRYLQSIMNKLYPKYKNKIRVKIINDPRLNAFALANGTLFFNIGLLARIDNEAQLATLLGHEGAHYIKKHILRHRVKLKSTSAVAVLIGAGPDSVTISSLYISGFSRDLEREADIIAFARMRRSGYDIRQAPLAFKKLLADAKANNEKYPSLFATHPKLIERIASYNKLIAQHPAKGGRIGQALFLKKTQKLRMDDLDANLKQQRFGSMILILTDQNARIKYPRYYPYYLGEAYRQRNLDNDIQKAYFAYQRAITASPNFAPSYRAIGIYYLKHGQKQKARTAFRRYLKLAPKSSQAAYVRQYLDELSQ